ncbi:MAG TPA: hypothetical protein VK176_04415 [Phycisphaerales bacterium]|nr:hypothetical protein [Phycisphaerales bacterium]
MITREAVEAAMSRSEGDLAGRWLHDYYLLNYGIAPSEAKSVPGNPVRSFMDWMNAGAADLCDRWNVCDLKKQHDDSILFAAALAELYVNKLQYSTDGAISVSVLAVRYGIDTFCHCE